MQPVSMHDCDTRRSRAYSGMYTQRHSNGSVASRSAEGDRVSEYQGAPPMAAKLRYRLVTETSNQNKAQRSRKLLQHTTRPDRRCKHVFGRMNHQHQTPISTATFPKRTWLWWMCDIFLSHFCMAVAHKNVFAIKQYRKLGHDSLPSASSCPCCDKKKTPY